MTIDPLTGAEMLPELIAALSDPRAYSHEVDAVEVRHTHISVVFLAGPFAYKIKKPLRLDFLDYSTLERRRHFCHEEVRINRRLAPGVYQGVAGVTRERDGRLVVDGSGETVEWAVRMTRLPPEATFAARLDRGELSAGDLVALAGRVAAFHEEAEGGAEVAASARFEAVSRNARDNFDQAEEAGQVGEGRVVPRPVFDRARALTMEAMGRLRPLIERRAERGVPRDTHGDLRLDHVYRWPVPGAEEVTIIDGIEFNARFRHADPAAEVAFLAMDLIASGRRDLAKVFVGAYVAASGDAEIRALLPFYVGYRAAVRAKVEGFKAGEPEVPEAQRVEARELALSRWFVVLDALEEPARRPALVLIGGLPGAGKSTLARGLAERFGFTVIRSDEVRKELAGEAIAASDSAGLGFGEGIYTKEWTDRTYEECLRRAARVVLGMGRALVDASFREDGRRREFLAAARRWGVPAVLLIGRADAATTRARLEARRGTGDASDADWSVHQRALERWEAPGPIVRPHAFEIDTAGTSDETLALALGILQDQGLVGEDTPTEPPARVATS